MIHLNQEPATLATGRARYTMHEMLRQFADEQAGQHPATRVDAQARHSRYYLHWLQQLIPQLVNAGQSEAMALIEEDFGPEVALAVARELVVYVKRPGGQEQFSEPLKFQVASTRRFADLVAWMLGHLDQDLSVERLAGRVNLCPRQFSRRFTAEFNNSPAAFVQRVRLDEARKRLSAASCTVESVADSVGFRDPDSFRRAFVQCFGVPPKHYRSRFLANSKSRRAKV